MDYNMMLKAFAIGFAALMGSASLLYFKMKPHNPVEEIAEFVIKEETGQSVDLSVVEALDPINTTPK